MKILHETSSKHFIIFMLVSMLCITLIGATLEKIDSEEQYERVLYIVQPGDTLMGIGKRHFSEPDELLRWVTAVKRINGFEDKVYLKVGEEIVILTRTERGK